MSSQTKGKSKTMVALETLLRPIQVVMVVALIAVIILGIVNVQKSSYINERLEKYEHQRKLVNQDMINKKKEYLQNNPSLTSPTPRFDSGLTTLKYPRDFVYVGCLRHLELNKNVSESQCKNETLSQSIYTCPKIYNALKKAGIYGSDFYDNDKNIFFELSLTIEIPVPNFTTIVVGGSRVHVKKSETISKFINLIPVNLEPADADNFKEILDKKFSIDGTFVENTLIFKVSSRVIKTDDLDYASDVDCGIVAFTSFVFNKTHNCTKLPKTVLNTEFITKFKDISEAYCSSGNSTADECTACMKDFVQRTPVQCSDGSFGCLEVEPIPKATMPDIGCNSDKELVLTGRIGAQAWQHIKAIANDINSVCNLAHKSVMLCQGQDYLLNGDDESNYIKFDNYAPPSIFQMTNDNHPCYYGGFTFLLPIGNSSFQANTDPRTCTAGNTVSFSINSTSTAYTVAIDDGKSETYGASLTDCSSITKKKKAIGGPYLSYMDIALLPDTTKQWNDTCSYFTLESVLTVIESIELISTTTKK